jgi:hypothetical protein
VRPNGRTAATSFRRSCTAARRGGREQVAPTPSTNGRKRTLRYALGVQVGGGNQVAGAAGAKEFEVLKLAALLVASAAAAAATAAAATATDTLVSSSPWWERVTVTMDGNGKPEACRYETSRKAAGEACDVDSGPASIASKASSSKGEVTRITFERRFNPGSEPAKTNLQAGDTLLGGQIMALAIDSRGAVKGCRVVARSGEMQPQYSCDDATAEKFQASVGGAQTAERQGYMTILVYGHSEHMV